MKCVFCGFADTRVVDSRPQSGDSRVRRRRECESCKRRFTTTELPGDRALSPELFSPMIVKKNGDYERLDRDKLARSVAVSLRKSRRAAVNPDAVAGEVADEVAARATPADTREIGEMILARLKALDPMGYLRYASVHREMSSPDDFAKLLRELGDDEREPDSGTGSDSKTESVPETAPESESETESVPETESESDSGTESGPGSGAGSRSKTTSRRSRK